MRKSLTCGALLLLAARTPVSWAQSTPEATRPAARLEERSAGYCDWVQGMGEAEAALELAPEVFGSFGAVNTGEAEGGTALGKPKLRVTAGLSYDFVGLYRGRTIHRRAAAECRRHQALSSLQAAVRQGSGLGEDSALEARARVLQEALPRAEALVTTLRDDLKEGRATLEELNAVQVRLDHLRSLSTDTALARERLAARPVFARGQRLEALLEELRAADDAVESEVGGLRRARAWQLSVRGGYDEVFDVDQDVPLFGQVMLTYDLGHLWQGKANARARDGRRRATLHDVEGMNQQVSELLVELRSRHRTEEARLREVTALVTDLEGQLRDVEALQTREIRRFRDYLLLELARLRAEQAYLTAHVEALTSFLGSTAP
ncbi:hypothetical protein LXT21_15585 [Myxococcus sp. K38C18041901]|uniref:hypothetical protein n=1 Tax=Myxococcus guangdongensis TaxID=2906760 RepID=UPI0020A79001|nr:hypothetical protein [Myxococcus guangdongensis]MCP3060205.1 hypothetical protein [Myxococcus guangdongensis]